MLCLTAPCPPHGYSSSENWLIDAHAREEERGARQDDKRDRQERTDTRDRGKAETSERGAREETE
jgi:hypothetical protein